MSAPHPATCECFLCWCERHPQVVELLVDLALMTAVVIAGVIAFKVEIGIQ